MLRVTELVKKAVRQEPPPTTHGKVLIWNITRRCPLACLHCYESAGKTASHGTEEVQLLQWAEQLTSAGIGYVVLSGGEPLLRWGTVCRLAARLQSLNIGVALSTSGILLTSRHLKDMELFNYVGVSIDGNKPTHETMRGLKGSFDRSVRAVQMLLDRGVRTGIRFTLCQLTASSLWYVVELACGLGVHRFYLSHLMGAGRGSILSPLTGREYVQVMSEFLSWAIDHSINGGKPHITTGNAEADALLLFELFSERHPEKAPALLASLEASSISGTGICVLNLDADGTVYPDPYLRVPAGNLRLQSLSEIIENSPVLERLRRRLRNPPKECRECSFSRVCKGGTPARAFLHHKTINRADPLCWAQLKSYYTRSPHTA